MGEFIEVSKIGELKDGVMKKVSIHGRDILVVRVGERCYATDNRCSHMGGDLSQGILTGTTVTCPRHHSQFDLRDGRVIRWTDWSGLKLTAAKLFKTPIPLKTYDVKIDGEKVLIDMK